MKLKTLPDFIINKVTLICWWPVFKWILNSTILYKILQKYRKIDLLRIVLQLMFLNFQHIFRSFPFNKLVLVFGWALAFNSRYSWEFLEISKFPKTAISLIAWKFLRPKSNTTLSNTIQNEIQRWTEIG